MKKGFIVKLVLLMAIVFGVIFNGNQSLAAEVKFNPENAKVMSVAQGDTFSAPSFMLGEEYVNLENKDWSVGDTSIVDLVEEDGVEKFKALKPGETTITSQYKGKSVNCTIKVFSPIKMLQVKIVAKKTAYKVRMTNPNDNAITINKKNAAFVCGPGVGGAKVVGGKSIKIGAHKTVTFSLTADPGEYYVPERSLVAVKYKDYKFMLHLPRKKGKTEYALSYWMSY